MKSFLSKLKNNQNLSFNESKEVFEILMNGKASDNEIFDFLNAINYSKKVEVYSEDPLAHKEYKPFVINRFLSQNLDSILYVNEMNQRPHCDSELQFHYFINSLGWLQDRVKRLLIISINNYHK